MSLFPTVRNPLLSLLQSAAGVVARRQSGVHTDITEHPLVAAAAHTALVRDDPTRAYSPPGNTSVPAMTCAGLGLQLLEALAAKDAARQRETQDRLSFSMCDPLWAETLLDYGRDFADGKLRPIPYVPYTAIGDFTATASSVNMRIALISDRGTGTDEARQVAALIARQQPDAVIHLGDVYYAGTAEECSAHFLAPLREALPGKALFTLCGNHDVYSGGQGYYGLLREIGQPASYFCLRSPDRSWQILAADTGLHDRDPFDVLSALTSLEPAEELWHEDKLRGFPGQTIFLTHHQPFSAYAQIGPLSQHNPVNPNLMASHARLAAAGEITVWFWGHEHSLRLYTPYRGVAAGRNIGFGAIPVEATPDLQPLSALPDPPAIVADVTLDVVDGAYTHGFALLELGAGRIDASYWALTRPDGPMYRESFTRGLTA
jgi:Calcineurin-like phosphoesterase